MAFDRKWLLEFYGGVKPTISRAAVQTPLTRIGSLTEIERSNLHKSLHEDDAERVGRGLAARSRLATTD
jgi:hypothetical protein